MKAAKLADVVTLAQRVLDEMEGGPAIEDEGDTEASVELYSKLNKHFPKGGTVEQVGPELPRPFELPRPTVLRSQHSSQTRLDPAVHHAD
jgi:hypothetical protein